MLLQSATQVVIVVDGAQHLAAKLANLTEQQLAVELIRSVTVASAMRQTRRCLALSGNVTRYLSTSLSIHLSLFNLSL